MSHIHPTAIIENSEIGDDVTVGAYSVISNSTIMKGCEVGCQVDITDSTIGQNSEILNKARILNTTTGTSCIIGSEVKGCELGDNNVSKHTGTVLRAVASGDHCNYGGGVKFANYDGKGKGDFRLGNEVFIGCNTVVSTKKDITRTIGDHAKIGALCHIKADIGEGSLVYVDDTTGTLVERENYYSPM